MPSLDDNPAPSRWFLLAGLLMVIRAAIELAEPVYYSPESLLDYSAVVVTSLALASLSAALFSLWRHSPLRRGAHFLLLAAIGTAVEAIGNFMEDAMGLAIGADLYSGGGMTGALGLLLAAVAMLTVPHRLRWVGLFLVTALGGSIFPDDGGLFLSGAALLGLGLWLRRRPAL